MIINGFLLQSFFALFIRVLGAGIVFIFNLLISRKLGDSEAGKFFLVFSLVMVLSSVGRLGYENTVLRFSGECRSNKFLQNKILTFGLLKAGFFSSIICILMYILSPYISMYFFKSVELEEIIRISLPSVIGISALVIISMSFQSIGKVYISIPCQSVCHLMLCLVLMYFFNIVDAKNLTIIYTISVIFCALFFLAYRYLPPRNKSFNFDEDIGPSPIELKRSAYNNWIIIIIQQVALWGGAVFCGIWVSPDNIAHFSAAQRVSMLTSFMLVAVNLVVAPKFAELSKNKKFVELKKIAINTSRALIALVFPFSLFIIYYSDWIMGLFGPGFVKGSILLEILVLGQIVNVITGSVSDLLVMTGHEKDMRNISIISGVIFITLNLLLIPFFDVLGAAVATSVSIAFQNILACYFVYLRHGFFTLKFWQSI